MPTESDLTRVWFCDTEPKNPLGRTTIAHCLRLVTPSTDKHHFLDSEDDFRSGCQNVSNQQQLFSELPSHGRSTITQQELSYTYGETILLFIYFFARYIRNQQTSWINIILTVKSPESAANSRGFEFTKNNSCTPCEPIFRKAENCTIKNTDQFKTCLRKMYIKKATSFCFQFRISLKKSLH